MALSKKKTMKKHDVKSVYQAIGRLRSWLGVKRYGKQEQE